MRIGVVGHLPHAGLRELVQHVVSQAATLDLALSFEPDLLPIAGAGAAPLEDPLQLDAMMAFGGDGTLLRAARLLGDSNAPILGVNIGKLGFLTTCRAEEFAALLPRFVRGEYTAEQRMALETQWHDTNGLAAERIRALNDVVLHKGGFARMLHLSLWVNGERLGSLAADGMIVSTPTGSTGYSLSAGGPVVDPTLESILVTPVAAHTLAMRSFVLPATAVIEMQPEDTPEEVLVTVDGQVGTRLRPNQRLIVRRSPQPVRIVRMNETTFFGRLRQKMSWGGLAGRDA
jgi:NAD+ kinase